jgi:hypothetical protein
MKVSGRCSFFDNDQLLLSTLWKPDGILRNDVGTLKPSLTVVVDGRGYIAPYELMVRLAERNVTQTEWIELAER